ncbi:coiled-coil domain-containing protein [Bacillus marasmi]|uniref:coiled-coil domain-containing protein n=1 Tax=Bacillus marasmi TaxID=1926279 RepID=UPI0011CBD249|nr:C40 family peptidase [Bacillus marasmi]
MIKKKLLVLNTTVLIGLGSVFSLPVAHADSISTQRSSLQAQITQANQQISAVQNELAQLNEQIKRTEKAIQDNEAMIAKTQSDIDAANLEIQKLEEEIASLKEAIEKRNEILKERARSYQETGNVKYVDVILGSSSFTDFVDRIGAVATIMNADKELREKHEADVKAVEEKQASVKGKLGDLNNMKVELEGMRTGIMMQKEQNDNLRAELKAQEAAGLSTKASLQQQDRSLAAQQAPTKTQSTSGGNFSTGVPSYVASASASEKIQIVTTVGNRYIGNSVYVFGGGRNAYDVANGRFDCSGFVHWAFSQAGISIGASTDSLKNSGRRVSTNEMRPGDLVFFNTYKTDGHVGIYLGGGRFIGSQDSTGVAIANMSSGYWANTFSGRVIRIIE